MSTPSPVEPQPQQPPAQILPSLIRTVVPMVVGWVIAQLAVHGFNLPPGTVEQVVTWLITAAYYGLIRLLETRFKPIWGWLLGLPKAPTYQAPAAPSPTDPEGAIATVDTPGDVPPGTPVDVVVPDATSDDEGPEPDPAALQAFLEQTAAEHGIDDPRSAG